jgi:two-component system, chemotaxis family, protein-glutamate methylesterase/glutaminase
MKEAPATRVLICDDSHTYAFGLRHLLEYDGDISVVAEYSTAEEAIAALPQVKPDLLTMDVLLPGMNGLAAVEEIMSYWPVPIIVLSGSFPDAPGKAAAALAAGALDTADKADLDLSDPGGNAAAAFRRRVRMASRARVIRHPRASLRRSPVTRGPARGASVIGICGSMGGPYVLSRLLGGLPAAYPIPILVVQHITAGFTEGLARWLDQTVPPPVRVATEEPLRAPGVWLAPEGAHLKLAASGRLQLDRQTTAGLYRPSGDVLLNSIAKVAGRTGVALVLTGMGKDGAAGAAAVRGMGGLAVAQSEESAMAFGMPQALIVSGVDLVLDPDEIVGCLAGLHYVPLPGRGTGP